MTVNNPSLVNGNAAAAANPDPLEDQKEPSILPPGNLIQFPPLQNDLVRDAAGAVFQNPPQAAVRFRGRFPHFGLAFDVMPR